MTYKQAQYAICLLGGKYSIHIPLNVYWRVEVLSVRKGSVLSEAI